MRRTLGPLLLTAVLTTGLLAGCGSESAPEPRAHDTASSGSPGVPTDTSAPAGGAVDFTQVALVSQTAAGGDVDPRATVLDDRAAVGDFADQFSGDKMTGKLTSAVRAADVPDGETLVGAVVAIGCDVPPGVVVGRKGGDLVVAARKVPNPMQECFAPVTTVALVTVDSDAV